jgi:UMF1 family MFS transporter
MPEMPAADAEPGPAGRRLAWILLDWAASGFSTVLITLVVVYVERVVCADSPWGLAPGVIWPWTLAVAMLASALVAPGLSAWADRRRRHRTALLSSVAAGVGGLFLLALVPAGGGTGGAAGPASRLTALAAVVIANVGFDMAAIFTGSLLAAIAPGRLADRLSAQGFAAGYAGGAVALLLATGIVQAHDALGLTAAGGLRAAFAFTGLWWLLFSLPITACRFDALGPAGSAHADTAAGELASFLRLLLRGPDRAANAPPPRSHPLLAVLAGSMLVLGAVQTAISQFSSVAIEEFHLKPEQLVRLVLLVQALALPGALGIGLVSERLGRNTALVGCLAGWVGVLGLSWFVTTVEHLYVLAALIALVLGGVQSVIRAAVADAAPAGRAGVSFGLLQVGSKLAGAAAGLAFGGVALASGLPRSGLIVLLVQIGLGWWVLTAARSGRAGRDDQPSRPSTSRIE